MGIHKVLYIYKQTHTHTHTHKYIEYLAIMDLILQTVSSLKPNSFHGLTFENKNRNFLFDEFVPKLDNEISKYDHSSKEYQIYIYILEGIAKILIKNFFARQ